MGHGWQIVARIILKFRILILLLVAVATTFMWLYRGTELTHNFIKIVPENDPDYIEYAEFRERFGDDGNAMVVCLQGEVFTQQFLNELFRLTKSLEGVDAVQNVVSLPNALNITADQDEERFNFVRIMSRELKSQAEVDSLKNLVASLPFYDGILLNEAQTSALILVSIDPVRLDTKEKLRIVNDVKRLTNEAADKAGAEALFSGLPTIRTHIMSNLPKEMIIFLLVALAILALTLYFFFRSITAVIFPMVVVGIVAVWSVGFIGLLGFKITILTAVIPSLITVIGIPNSIYLLTKYHFEYKKSKNKMKSLVMVIQKIGVVTVMTNATTAVGFAVLAFTKIPPLREFGIVAGLSVATTFIISLMLIPIFFSFLPAPSWKQVRHTERRSLEKVIRFLDFITHRRRPVIYFATLVAIGLGFWGLYLLEPVSFVTDDIPKEQKIYSDLQSLESDFGGVMPFEIIVNTHRKTGITKTRTLKQLDEFQGRMSKIPQISRALSILDLVKFSRQALFSGVKKEYQVPSRDEMSILLNYIRKSGLDSLSGEAALFDSTFSIARITSSIEDLGSKKMKVIIDTLDKYLVDVFVENAKPGRLKPEETYKLFGPEGFVINYKGEEYKGGETFVTDTTRQYTIVSGEGKVDYSDRVKITGTTKIFIKSNEFLINNLIQSLFIAFIIIALMMAVLFGSIRMVLIALVPNFLPLLLTAAIMGFMGIALKPSTALIFSVAFGIAVDDTIHYLARYRLARKTGDNIVSAVSNSFKDTGVSMIYTSIVLFFGFVIFSFSAYGGIEALGKLTSITLLIALFTNLLLLPSMLITFQRDKDQMGGILEYEDDPEDFGTMHDLLNSEENGQNNRNPEHEEIS